MPLAALAAGDDKLFAIRRLPERFAVIDYLIRRKAPADAPEPPLIGALRETARQHAKEIREIWKSLS